MKQYTPDSHWYILQYLPVLPLILIALALHGQDSALWVVSTSLVISVGYLLVTSYRVYQQVKYPMISTDEKGILLHKHSTGNRQIEWRTIKRVQETRFCIKLDVDDEQEAIPTNALNDTKKGMLMDEIRFRTNVKLKAAA